jgi:N6-L-threonylcarbamoyladenine synthase
MIILAIETSCDDTCLALIKAEGKTKPRFKILANTISSQVKIHKKWGGVYPTLAKREHQKNLPLVLKRAISKAGSPKVNLIAVTTGPGLEPCLWVGVNFAKELAKKLKLQIIPINHIEAHIFANFLPSLKVGNRELKKEFIQLFPAICLVVSGGHTQLILMKGYGNYKILGETRDDAAGECFDKVAKILGLGYPGGPVISKLAKSLSSQGNSPVSLPRPMIYQRNYDFSFSGLKTAVLYHFRSQTPKIRKSKKYIQAVGTETQQAIIDVLIYKTLRAAKEYRVKAIILGGGVAANYELRKQLRKKIKKDLPNIKYLIPDIKYCTDNAAMVAAAAYFHYSKGKAKSWKEIRADANLKIGPKNKAGK